MALGTGRERAMCSGTCGTRTRPPPPVPAVPPRVLLLPTVAAGISAPFCRGESETDWIGQMKDIEKAHTYQSPRRGGCAPLPVEQLRTVFVKVHLTVEEKAAVATSASAARLPLSVFAREVLVRSRVPKPVAPPEFLLAWQEFAKSAANLNQISAHLNRVAHGGRDINSAVIEKLGVLELAVNLLGVDLDKVRDILAVR